MISEIESDISPYQANFPGYCRYLGVALRIFKAILRSNKQLVLEHEEWKNSLINKLLNNQNQAKAESLQSLRAKLIAHFVDLLDKNHKQQHLDKINDLEKIINMITNAYLAKNKSQLMVQRNRERSTKLLLVSKTKSLEEDIAKGIEEAEKCIKHLVSKEDYGKLTSLRGQILGRITNAKSVAQHLCP